MSSLLLSLSQPSPEEPGPYKLHQRGSVGPRIPGKEFEGWYLLARKQQDKTKQPQTAPGGLDWTSGKFSALKGLSGTETVHSSDVPGGI